MRKLGALILLGASVAVTGCFVGDDGDDPIDPDLDGTSDDRNTELGIVCEATFNLSGTFAPGLPAAPTGVTGCWPVGTWTFTAALGENACASAPSALPSYEFVVDRAEDPNPEDQAGYIETYTYMGDISTVRRLKVSAGGAGDCEGGLEIFSADGTQFWNLKPSQRGTVLGGIGEYAKYTANAR